MAKSQDTAAFESLVNQKNKDMFLKNRGAKNQFKEFEGPDGKYYGRITLMKLGKFDLEQYQDGKKTGFKETVPTCTLNAVTVCSDDNTIPPSELEKWKGEPANIMYMLNTDEAWQRFYSDIYTMTGFDTNKLVLLTQDIKEDGQATLADVCDAVTADKPYCRFVVTTSTKNQKKYANYRGSVSKEDLEQLLGHSLDGDAVETFDQVPEAPFDEGTTEGTTETGGEEEPVWSDEHSLWHMVSTDMWYDENGEETANPNAPKVPPKWQPPASFTKKTEATKTEAPKTAVRKPGTIMKK